MKEWLLNRHWDFHWTFAGNFDILAVVGVIVAAIAILWLVWRGK